MGAADLMRQTEAICRTLIQIGADNHKIYMVWYQSAQEVGASNGGRMIISVSRERGRQKITAHGVAVRY